MCTFICSICCSENVVESKWKFCFIYGTNDTGCVLIDSSVIFGSVRHMLMVFINDIQYLGTVKSPHKTKHLMESDCWSSTEICLWILSFEKYKFRLQDYSFWDDRKKKEKLEGAVVMHSL